MYTANAYGTLMSNQHDPTSANSITSRDKQQEVWAGPKEKYAVLGDKHGKNCQQHHQYLLLHWRNLLPPWRSTLCLQHPLLFFSADCCGEFSVSHLSLLYFCSKISFQCYSQCVLSAMDPTKKNLHAYETVSPSFVQWLLSSHEPFAVSLLYYLLPNLNIRFILFSHRITCISVLLNYSYLGSDFYLKALL